MKLALPKGPLRENTAALLKQADLAIGEYHVGSRSYRPQCQDLPALFTKVFHEKDIAIQVAIGNYDLGICRLDWVEELLVKYRSDAVVKVADLGFGKRELYAVAAKSSGVNSFEALKSYPGSIRIVTEYPNLAESFALKRRLRRFQIFPAWGRSGVFPPENAELAIMASSSADKLRELGLLPVCSILKSSACLVANRNSLGRKNLNRLLASLSLTQAGAREITGETDNGIEADVLPSITDGNIISLALPDGHQQPPTTEFLKRSGLEIDGYNVGKPEARPRLGIDGIMVKVIRPQDMPLHVANGNFDLAVTGRDWLLDHRYRFPSSPVEELLDLDYGRVKIVVVVTNDMSASSTGELAKLKAESTLRVASEYVNIADKYINDNHLTPCKIIPTWGASEAFLPEDADVLIENTETGSTIARHNLKIIDTLFESSACLIGNSDSMKRRDKKEKMLSVIGAMRHGIEADRPIA